MASNVSRYRLLTSFSLTVNPLIFAEFRRENFWQQLKASRIPEILHSADGEDDVKLSIEACDDESAFARAYIQELSVRRNALVATVQLPSELLATIFHFLLPVHERRSQDALKISADLDREIAASTRSLIAASHVCQRWRQVALDFSSLWTVLWTTNKFWLPEMLARAKDSPLVILQLHNNEWIYGSSSWQLGVQMATSAHPHECMDILKPVLFETKQPIHLCLHLAIHDQTQADFWIKVLTRPAPYLEVLQVSTEVSYGHFAPLAFTDNFLGGYTPALKSLTLKGPCSHEVLWTLPVLHGLVHLTLSLTPPGNTRNVSLQDTLDALREMQQLESLSIEFPSLYTPSPQRPSYFLSNSSQEGTEVCLPCLMSLSVKGGMPDTTTLTKCLSIPPRAEIQCEILLGEEDVRPQMAGEILALLHPVLPMRSTMETYELVISHSPDVALCVRGWEQAVLLDRYLDDRPASPRLSLTFSVRAADLWGGLPQLQVAAETLARDIRILVDILNMLSPLLPRHQSHDLRCRTLDDPQPYAGGLVTHDHAILAEALNTFPETRRLIFSNCYSCLDIIPAIASNDTLLRHLESIHAVERPAPNSYQSSPPFPPPFPNNESERAAYEDLAEKLRHLAKTRDLHTFECRGRLIKDEYAHLFEGVTREVIWSRDARDAV